MGYSVWWIDTSNSTIAAKVDISVDQSVFFDGDSCYRWVAMELFSWVTFGGHIADNSLQTK